MSEDSLTEHKRNSFLATFEPRGQSAATPRSTPPLKFKATIETESYAAAIYYGEREMLTTSADGSRVLLLAGDVCRPQTDNVGAAILALYEQRGLDFAKDLDGAFSLLLIDRRARQIMIVTDRMNSIKVFASWDSNTLVVSNSLYLHPVQGRKIDRTAVACTLASGYITNNRTLFEGVEMLDGASVFHLRDGKLDPHKYWRYIFERPAVPASPAALQQEFGDLLIESVKRRLRPGRPIYLSLTAGYDGCALMGILAEHLDVSGVRCFTYAHGQQFRTDSDEVLGAQLAAHCGYEHRILESFDGDAAQTLRLNALLGGGMTRLCDEADVWVRLGEEVAGGPLPLLYTGDTLQLGGDWSVKTFDDIASAAKLRDFSTLSWLEPFIGRARYAEMFAATRAEIELAVKRTPRVEDGRDLREMVRFDQYHSRAFGTWREYYAGRYFETVHPLLDNDVIDFIRRLPFEQRRDRKLYKATVTSMFPKLFQIPRADSASYATFWPDAIKRQSAELRALIEGQPSPLDDVIAPDVLLALLSAGGLTTTRANVALTSRLRPIYHLLKRLKWTRRRFLRPWLFKSLVPVEKFVASALVLRGFLSEVT